MTTKHIFSIAVLAIMMTACSSDDATEPQPAGSRAIPFRAAISALAATRGLTAPTADGEDITAAWVKGEKIVLVHGATTNELEVKNVSQGNAIVEGSITNYIADETAYLVYVGNDPNLNIDDITGMLNSALESAGATAYTPEIIASTFTVFSQEGTIESISSLCDYRLGQSKLVKKGSYVTFDDSPVLSSQFAVWQLSLTNKNDNGKAIEAKEFIVKDASSNDIIQISLNESVSSSFYVVFPESSDASFTFRATDAADASYSCTLTDITLVKGGFYQSTLSMEIEMSSIGS